MELYPSHNIFMGHFLLFLDLIRSTLRMYGLWKQTDNSIFKYKTTNRTVFNLRKNTFDSGVIIESWWLKSYTRHLKNVPNDAVVIDIGAHIGAFSLLSATRYKHSRIFAFEPSIENFALLNKNIKTNNLTKRISTFNLAVTDGKKNSIILNLHPSNLGMHSVVFDYDLGQKGQRHEVLTTSLPRIFSENKIKTCDLLKMDCEGAEYNIIFSTPKKFLEKIKNIVTEYDDHGGIEKLKKFLEDAGFKTKFYQTIPIPLPSAIKRLYHLKIGKAPMLLAFRPRSGRKTDQNLLHPKVVADTIKR